MCARRVALGKDIISMDSDIDNAEIERQILFILSLHKGRERRISRWELVEKLFGREAGAVRSNNNPHDRKVREIIEKYRDEYLICSSSAIGGGWMAGETDEVERMAPAG